MSKEKYYVVWAGVNPGIYTSWTDCQLQIKGFEGAKFKSFEQRDEAERAFASSPYEYIKPASEWKSAATHHQQGNNSSSAHQQSLPLSHNIIDNSIAVDAACSSNPGAMEYRGVHVASRQEIFHYGPIYGTNNIGEFLAIVHGLALLKQKGYDMPLYSDSKTAMSWVKRKKCNTNLERNNQTEELFRVIERAEKWLRQNSYTTQIIKWDTKNWGEIPADFGRK